VAPQPGRLGRRTEARIHRCAPIGGSAGRSRHDDPHGEGAHGSGRSWYPRRV